MTTNVKTDARRNIEAFVDARVESYKQAALAIHSHPETCNEERFACETLTKILKDEGFEVQTGIAGHPTGFDARFKDEKPGPCIVFFG